MSVTERCLQPGCTGAIDEGYCDQCGIVQGAADRSRTRVNGTVVPARVDGNRQAPNVDDPSAAVGSAPALSTSRPFRPRPRRRQ